MKISGEIDIATSRPDTFLYGCDPKVWHDASSEGRLGIHARSDDSFKLGDLIDISVDLNDISLHPVISTALHGIAHKGILAFESEITELTPHERIRVNGRIAVAGLGLAIDLSDGDEEPGHTTSNYLLDVNLLGKLKLFNGALSGLQTVLQTETEGYVERLGKNIETSAYDFSKAS